ncbi:MAG: hypothetical protein ACD_46C00684G0002 [uncultured bacterium]|nr:MAG: hypothetical protein ACD_46C00684G0002 [uncultured bacterium]
MAVSTRSNPQIIYHSLDFDGFLADKLFQKILREWIIDPKNSATPLSIDVYITLINKLIANNKDYEKYFEKEFENKNAKHFIIVGSDRQFGATDVFNGQKYQTGSCYPFFQALIVVLKNRNINIELDDFLMEDFLSNKNAGESFKEYCHAALSNSKNEEASSKTAKPIKGYLTLQQENTSLNLGKNTDRDKIILLVIQIQLAYKQGCKIFRFADDREDTVKALQDFFAKNNEFIPPDMNVSIIHCFPDNPNEKQIPEKTFTGKSENEPIVNINEVAKEVSRLVKLDIDNAEEAAQQNQPYTMIELATHLKQAQLNIQRNMINALSEFLLNQHHLNTWQTGLKENKNPSFFDWSLKKLSSPFEGKSVNINGTKYTLPNRLADIIKIIQQPIDPSHTPLMKLNEIKKIAKSKIDDYFTKNIALPGSDTTEDYAKIIAARDYNPQLKAYAALYLSIHSLNSALLKTEMPTSVLTTKHTQ